MASDFRVSECYLLDTAEQLPIQLRKRELRLSVRNGVHDVHSVKSSRELFGGLDFLGGHSQFRRWSNGRRRSSSSFTIGQHGLQLNYGCQSCCCSNLKTALGEPTHSSAVREGQCIEVFKSLPGRRLSRSAVTFVGRPLPSATHRRKEN